MQIVIDNASLKTLLMIGSFVEARDAFTAGHLWRTTQFVKLLGGKIGLSDPDIFILSVGGFLHDIGKIGIPDAILHKQGLIGDDEYEVIKTHPQVGYDIIREHPLAPLAQDVILKHHEWYNGGGYPNGLAQDEISFYARIISIVDAFDAMTNSRPYRKCMAVGEALSILEGEMDRQFDGKLVSYFLQIPVEDKLMHIVRHSEPGLPLVECPYCGPIIAIFQTAKDGDIVYCKGCRGKFQLHKSDDTFVAVFTGDYGDASNVKPEADIGYIDSLVKKSPDSLPIDYVYPSF